MARHQWNRTITINYRLLKRITKVITIIEIENNTIETTILIPEITRTWHIIT